MEALEPVIAKLGGEVLAWYYTVGDYDVVVSRHVGLDGPAGSTLHFASSVVDSSC
jgi:uncharacterized protein with GYD domain